MDPIIEPRHREPRAVLIGGDPLLLQPPFTFPVSFPAATVGIYNPHPLQHGSESQKTHRCTLIMQSSLPTIAVFQH